VDVNVGAAGMFAPPDRGLPDNGVVALGHLNRPGWVYADLDLEALRRVRREGQVLNARDWVRQPLALSGTVQAVPL
jgi:predicted amidohydrolase